VVVSPCHADEENGPGARSIPDGGYDPSLVDPDAKDLVRATAAGGVEGFFKTVGAALNELGQWGADVIRFQRFKTQVKVMQRAQQMCEETGIDPQAISLKVLVPLLENIGLEDDPEDAEDPAAAEQMQERWAALLANAALGDAGANVLPSFPRILNELMPEEAKMLEWLGDQSAGSALDTFKAQAAGYDWTRSRHDQPIFDVYVDNLERLQLISVSRVDREFRDFQRNVEERIKRIDGDPWGARSLTRGYSPETVQLTALGQAFITACMPPPEAVDAAQMSPETVEADA
jgi:hypothetical protein